MSDKTVCKEKLTYLVDWGNGFVGAFSSDDFEQEFNTPEKLLFSDLRLYKIKNVKIISPAELDLLRGYHKPSFQEYLGLQVEKDA